MQTVIKRMLTKPQYIYQLANVRRLFNSIQKFALKQGQPVPSVNYAYVVSMRNGQNYLPYVNLRRAKVPATWGQARRANKVRLGY